MVADEALKVVVWKLCNATSYGSIKRAFGSDPAKSNAVRTLCSDSSAEDLIGAESNVH